MKTSYLQVNTFLFYYQKLRRETSFLFPVVIFSSVRAFHLSRKKLAIDTLFSLVNSYKRTSRTREPCVYKNHEESKIGEVFLPACRHYLFGQHPRRPRYRILFCLANLAAAAAAAAAAASLVFIYHLYELFR